MQNTNYLVCKMSVFNSVKDEEAYWDWINKIDCIENYEALGDELYLKLKSDDIYDKDLRDLLGLFHRYHIDMKQLKRFLTDHNKHWFFDNKKAYWHKKVFG